MGWEVRVLANRYADSVRLMSVARTVRARPEVLACELGMATPANLETLAGLGAQAEGGPGDLVIAVQVDDGQSAADGLDQAEQELAAAAGGGGGGGAEGAAGAARARPRSLAAAARDGAPNLALISVPGEYAAFEAHRALTEGMHVFLFSDHVSVEQEIELKSRGRELGRLVMGPGCGTAMLGGTGLGFANVVRSGPVGVVAAAGTGAQEVACLLDAAGVGVSHIVGVGGRDLSEKVGGIMFAEAIGALERDDATETLLLVSKPPSPAAVASLADVIPASKRVVAAFVGWEGGEAPFEVHDTLEAGARAAAGAAPEPDDAPLERAVDERRADLHGHRLLGLYSGGSLAHEAVTLLEPDLGPLRGNVGHGGEPDGAGHVLLDLGEEEYTEGRPHPMVDLEVRLGMLEEVGPEVGCVLLDVVLGHGAHADPASQLAGPLGRLARERIVIVRVCGTAGDPQDAPLQEQILRDAGAIVAASNAQAARLAGRALRR